MSHLLSVVSDSVSLVSKNMESKANSVSQRLCFVPDINAFDSSVKLAFLNVEIALSLCVCVCNECVCVCVDTYKTNIIVSGMENQ